MTGIGVMALLAAGGGGRLEIHKRRNAAVAINVDMITSKITISIAILIPEFFFCFILST
ncbi:MAG: hypothetical protein QW530_00885 [Candidatus Micrarchaeaceae archaeon]